MRPLSELRNVLDFYPHQLNSYVKYFSEEEDFKIDYDVYLPSLGMNLQRDFVWNHTQKNELIKSMLLKRHIPRMAIIFTIDNVYQIIDGKQRLSTMISFYRNEFKLHMDGSEYYFKDLPKEHQNAIARYSFAYNVVNEDYGKTITDKQKIEWFKFINFVGTPQDEEHIQKLTK